MINQKRETAFFIVAFSPVGDGISGGDRIFIELAKNLSKENVDVRIVTWEDGIKMCARNGLDGSEAKFSVVQLHFWPKLGFVVNYFARVLYGIFWALFANIDIAERQTIYSASEFWMDIFPSWILKLRYGKKVQLVTTWFQTAPNPLKGFAEGKRENRYRFRAFLYWVSQLPSKFIISRFSDFVLVNNEDERKQFPDLNKKNLIFVFIGAIDLERIKKWIQKNKNVSKKYDAVFQGRFHPQKGVIELIDIWSKVVDKKPDARLAMIGDGPLMEDVRMSIKQKELGKNITLLGYVFDGNIKYKTFAESRVVVHPALYDSGGMASAEAMAFGLPCVGFNLKSYKSYYPKGMVKVPIGEIGKFASEITHLLEDKNAYSKMQKEAIALIENNWSWEDRARQLLSFISS